MVRIDFSDLLLESCLDNNKDNDSSLSQVEFFLKVDLSVT